MRVYGMDSGEVGGGGECDEEILGRGEIAMAVTYGLRPDLSPQQKAVIDWVQGGSGSLNLIAYAGCAKTSTLMECAKVIKGTGVMCAFNKSIADEFSARLAAQQSYNVKGGTIHSVGYAAWRKIAKRLGSPDGRKVAGLARKRATWDRKLSNIIADVVSFGKKSCLGVEGSPAYTDQGAWERVIDYFELREEIPTGIRMERFVGYCIEVYEESLNLCESVIDFDDMLLAPLYFQAPFQKYDWVFVDEGQDLDEARRQIMLRMMHGDGSSRMIVTGDPQQCIYTFAGATHNSMDLMKGILNSTDLKLSVTFRCPKAVVDVAQTWVPDFEAHPNNPEGEVSLISHEQFFEIRDFDIDNDVILCRNTRPLVGIAGRLRKANIPCVVEGQSGKVLKALAVKWGDNIRIDEWLEYLDHYQAQEVKKYKDKENPEKAEYVMDKCNTMRDMAERVGFNKTVQDLVRYIDFLFGDSLKHALRLCTGHRAKGREWRRVFLVGRNRYMPSPWAKTAKELRSEENLAYVMVTRAKHALVEVDVPFKGKGESEWWEDLSSPAPAPVAVQGVGASVEQEEPF